MPELVQLALAIVAAGAVSGLLAGLFGIGGGAVIVPVLYQALALVDVDPSIRMHIAVGSSSAIIIPTSIRSFMSHRKRGAVDTDFLRSWVIAVPLGTVIAALVAAVASGASLRGVFAFLAFIFGLRLLFNRSNWRLGDDIPAGLAHAGVGVSIGFFSALMGIGGGILNNTYMALFGRPIHQAVATSSGVGVLISLPAAIGFAWAGWGEGLLPQFSLGYVNLAAVALIIPVSVLMAPLGVRLAHYLPPRRLEIALGMFLMFVSARFAWSLIGG